MTHTSFQQQSKEQLAISHREERGPGAKGPKSDFHTFHFHLGNGPEQGTTVATCMLCSSP